MEEKIYALLDDNNIVTNIIVADENFASQLGGVRIGNKNHCVIGELFNESDLYTNYILNEIKTDKINITKFGLADYLSKNPLLYTDGKYYSVTTEKQNLLNNAITVYNLKTAMGQTDAILEWNATGEECIEWQLNDLVTLAIAIADYVKPLVAKQQYLETLIKNCNSVEEVEAIEINYDTLI